MAKQMFSGLRNEIKDVMGAIAPITLAILLLQVLVLRSTPWEIATFLAGVVLVIGGFTLFLMGVKLGMLPMGEAIGAELSKSGSLKFILAAAFALTFLVTVAEPDVRVLTTSIESVSNGLMDRTALILVIAVGVGFFTMASALRIIYDVPIKWILAAGYGAVLLLSFLTPPEYLAISFDSGGVTTGPITVPVILALGVGITSVLSRRTGLSDSFGLIGLAFIGPIIGVMLLGVLSG